LDNIKFSINGTLLRFLRIKIKTLKNRGDYKMKCNQCQTDMIKDCDVDTGYGIKIKKKKKGFLNIASAVPNAAVCPNCGYVAFYIDEYREFSD
jgi:uncharacterized protein (DUF2225 family)